MARNFDRKVTVTFELSDGRELECRYIVEVTPGNYGGAWGDCYPDEFEQHEPEYYLDGEFVTVEQLPTGLDVIADAMYDADDSDKRFTFTQKDEY